MEKRNWKEKNLEEYWVSRKSDEMGLKVMGSYQLRNWGLMYAGRSFSEIAGFNDFSMTRESLGANYRRVFKSEKKKWEILFKRDKSAKLKMSRA